MVQLAKVCVGVCWMGQRTYREMRWIVMGPQERLCGRLMLLMLVLHLCLVMHLLLLTSNGSGNQRARRDNRWHEVWMVNQLDARHGCGGGSNDCSLVLAESFRWQHHLRSAQRRDWRRGPSFDRSRRNGERLSMLSSLNRTPTRADSAMRRNREEYWL